MARAEIEVNDASGAIEIFRFVGRRKLRLLSFTSVGGVTDGDKGDVTVSLDGTNWVVENGAVSLAKMAPANESVLIGRGQGAGAGSPQFVTLGTNLSMTGATLSATSSLGRGGTVLAPTAGTTVMVWRAPFACTVTKVWGHRKGGTGATVNARRNQASTHLSSDLSLSSENVWTDGGAVQNTAYVAGDDLEIQVVGVTGSVTEVAVQVDFSRP